VEGMHDSSVLARVTTSAGYRQVFARLAKQADAALYVSLLEATRIEAEVQRAGRRTVLAAAVCWTLPKLVNAPCVV
jgi:hypothetical protein